MSAVSAREPADQVSGRATVDLASGRATADLLIDRDRLSELVGRPVRATRLRHKPGLSTSAVLVDTERARPPGWVQVSYPGHVDKLRNALRRAGERGQLIQVREVPEGLAPGGLHLAHGQIDSDPRLQRGLDTVRSVHPSVHAAVVAGQLEVLRYNPQRRLVLRRPTSDNDALVIRVTAEKQREVHRNLTTLSEAGVPVLCPLATHALRRTRRVTVWPWFGTGDLQQARPDHALAHALAAGRALAGLHAVPADRLRFGAVPDPGQELGALVEDLGDLDPGAARRMRGLVDRVGERLDACTWEIGTVHGDFSADQVLVGADPSVAEFPEAVLTDFDRAGTGALAADLGTFAAAELLDSRSASGPVDIGSLPLTSALLEGYAEARGESGVTVSSAWLARALLSRVVEPFRAGHPDWVSQVHHRLDRVQEVQP